MNTLSQNLNRLTLEIDGACTRSGRSASEITVVAVTKHRSLDEIAGLYDLGIRDFGENRPQSLLERQEHFQSPANWHLIGPLQKNKVGKIVGHTCLIHSVDSFELGQKIAEVSKALGIQTSILLQVNVSGEESKQGLSQEECLKTYERLMQFPELTLRGLMTMAPIYQGTAESERVIRKTFADAKRLFDQMQNANFSILSMGMSGDFQLAIEEGATLIRVGSFLFN